MNVESVYNVTVVCFHVGKIAIPIASYIYNLHAENRALKDQLQKMKRRKRKKVVKAAS